MITTTNLSYESAVADDYNAIMKVLRTAGVDVTVTKYPLWYQIVANHGAFQCIVYGRYKNITLRTIWDFSHYKTASCALTQIKRALCLDT